MPDNAEYVAPGPDLYEWGRIHLRGLEELEAENKRLRQALDEARWIIANSDGVIGFRADRTTMSWPEVLKLYSVHLRAHVDGSEGGHYYGDTCLGGHGELADIEAREAELNDGSPGGTDE